MEHVYLLHHIREDDEYGDDAKLIGVYRSEASAKLAIDRLSSQPGFRDYPAGFEIGKYALDHDHWEEGFVDLPAILIPMQKAGADIWSPVSSVLLADGRFEVVGPVSDDEIWRYPPGTIVHCEVQHREDGDVLVAIAPA
ncbi:MULTISPECIES: hypothetical protein [unclassified Sphingomonas]|uniref:DUF7336 domain-containing protein n=1 Tax=unclassified Sphingomonas TaxID=196159 RepID=UPI0021517318|nr:MULTISPECIES: hypothetical protein [unclassified Sphingomonas]MCR5872637.1 hypothetical protein [Sphingomonas sp. J344]UUX99081.1 hypothetical protein LRS08_16535 [Sphingomonas sp. J315]